MPHLVSASFAPAALASVRSIYLTGPVSAPECLDAFLSAAVALRMLGLTVTGPFEGASAAALMAADAVVVLPEWQSSPAAGIDVVLAESLGKPTIPLLTMLTIDPAADAAPLGLASAS